MFVLTAIQEKSGRQIAVNGSTQRMKETMRALSNVRGGTLLSVKAMEPTSPMTLRSAGLALFCARARSFRMEALSASMRPRAARLRRDA